MPDRYIIDPVAFFVALIGGPVLFTLAFFWVLLIPVFALVMGGIPYLLIGTPVLLIYLRYRAAKPAAVAWLAFCAFLLGWVVLAILLTATTANNSLESMTAILPFGMFFAPCWGASFAWLYTRLAKDFFIHPRFT